MKKIGIIGPNKDNCSIDLYNFGFELGYKISSPERYFICGGLGGFMEAVCKGIKSSPNTFKGQTIGILPGEKQEEANSFIDIAIPTGLGINRNIIIIRASDILIAAGGGAGTLSEIAFAWQLNKKVLCITLFEGWSEFLAGKSLDNTKRELLIPVSSIEEILEYI